MGKNQIKIVGRGTPAEAFGILPGEGLVSINDHPIRDVLDYKYYSYDPELRVVVEDMQGEQRTILITKDAGDDLGLEFSTYLMDKAHSCANKCIFCFVDQLPSGMRETLYFMDDDARLSFLMGNYITLTNLSKREIQRIIDLHISPINLSVHATNPELRCLLLGSKRGGELLDIMKRFAKANITMNCQIVACPGLNDGEALNQSIKDLASMYPQVHSVSIVPLGLTKWRDGCYPLRPYQRDEALALVKQVEAFSAVCKERHGSSIFWCSGRKSGVEGKRGG